MESVKIKLTIAYEGTNYAGWQVQKIGIGVQQIVEEALHKIFQQSIKLHSSSRTDSGVHALGMVAHIEIPKDKLRIPLKKIPLAINAHLPEDIRVVQASLCAPQFHARFSATGKQYRYFIWNHPAHNPLFRRFCWHIPRKLDLQKMKTAAAYFLGTHDFKSFAANRNYKIENTVRTLWKCDIKKNGNLLTFIIEGNGFLYKMCRGIVGTIVQVGLGKYEPSAIKTMLEKRDRKIAGMSAPAHGLVLWKVFYDKKQKYSQQCIASEQNGNFES
ncbi:MAG: tRNA pseudouridine(38-40) synthase TruA [Verrucomicrobiia bacterium]